MSIQIFWSEGCVLVTLEQMREFVILAEERNYLVAADMLYSTQATLSRHIMAMEKELGFPLFNRSTKKIELTQEGSRFLVYARKAMKLQDDYLAELEVAKRSVSESLSVGYNALVAFYRFTDRLTQFMSEHPRIPIKMVENDTDILIKEVQNGSCDMAFVQEDPFHPVEGLEKLYISSDTLDVVLRKGHRLSTCTSIDLRQLAQEDFAIGVEDKVPGKIFVESCRHAGFEPQIARNGLVGPALFTWVGNSDCVGLEWHIPAQRHMNDRTVVIPVQPQVRAYTAIIYKDSRLSGTGRQLIDYFVAGNLSAEGKE